MQAIAVSMGISVLVMVALVGEPRHGIPKNEVPTMISPEARPKVTEVPAVHVDCPCVEQFGFCACEKCKCKKSK